MKNSLLKILLIPAVLLLVACYDSKNGAFAPLEDEAQQVALAQDCEEIGKLPNTQALFNRFHSLTNRILRLSAGPLTPGRIAELEKAHQELGVVSEQIQSLLRDDWVQPKWPLHAQWTFPHAKNQAVFRPDNGQVSAVYFAGREWPEWHSLVSMQTGEGSTTLTLSRTMSSLEACQMSPSLVLAVHLEDNRHRVSRTRPYRLTLIPKQEKTHDFLQ